MCILAIYATTLLSWASRPFFLSPECHHDPPITSFSPAHGASDLWLSPWPVPEPKCPLVPAPVGLHGEQPGFLPVLPQMPNVSFLHQSPLLCLLSVLTEISQCPIHATVSSPILWVLVSVCLSFLFCFHFSRVLEGRERNTCSVLHI